MALNHQQQMTSCVQAHDKLGSFGVKPRLQTLWREAHATLSAAESQKQQGSLSAKQKKAKRAANGKNNTDSAAAAGDALADTHMQSVPEQTADFIDPQQKAAFAACNSYMDLFLPNCPYPVR